MEDKQDATFFASQTIMPELSSHYINTFLSRVLLHELLSTLPIAFVWFPTCFADSTINHDSTDARH